MKEMIDFANWIGNNKWYKQTNYDIWEKDGDKSLSTLELLNKYKKSI